MFELLPKEDVIYKNLGFDYALDSPYGYFDNYFSSSQFWYLSFDAYLKTSYPNLAQNPDWYRKFFVSERELHPSAFANDLFTEALYQEIITNPKSGFSE